MRFSLLAAASAASFIQGAACTPLDERAAAPSAKIKQGTVVGTTTTVDGAKAAATQYLSIPFAKSPPLRFAPPEAPAAFKKPFSATKKGLACLQQFNDDANPEETKRIFNNPGGPPPPEGEDCLHLDVYVPPGTKAGDKKPVMFWIFGGSLNFGTKNLLFYDGSSYATNQDVIVVVPNYRTNVFGFPSSPEIKAPQQNAGLLDQRMALKWTHDNIASFGGDTSRVTIFGESAGGYSVKQLMALPPSPKQFSSAIMESQATLRGGDGPTSWNELVVAMGCSTAASPLKCMRGKKATDIQRTIEKNAFAFPVTFNDVSATADVRPLIENGKFAKVPFMIGTNQDEGRVFAHILGLDQPGANLTSAIESEFGSKAPQIESALKALLPALQTPYLLASVAITQLIFQCNTETIANVAQSHGYSVWRYLFNGTFPNTALFPNAGAFHSVEIPEAWGTYPRSNVLGKATPAQISLSKYMQTAWANIARNAAKGPGWAKYGATGNIQSLGYPKPGTGSPIRSSQIDQLCAVLGPIASAGGL